MATMIEALAALAWAQLWQVSLVAFAGLLLVRLSHRRNPHWAYLIWAIVVVKCVTPPLISGPFGVFSWWGGATPPPLAGQVASTLFASTPESELGLDARTLVNRAALAAPSWQAPSLRRWAASGMLAWAAVSGTVILGAVRGIRRASKKLRQSCRPAGPELEQLLESTRRLLGCKQQPKLLISPEGYGPFVYGWLRPVIVLPQALLEERPIRELQPILAHELAHVRRGDTLLSLVQHVAAAIWWFHPLVRLANRELSRCCELCCDSQAIAALQCSPRRYADSLLNVVELRRRLRWLPATAAVAAASVTSQRLLWIMEGNRQGFQPQTPRWCWSTALLFGLLVLPGARWHAPSWRSESAAYLAHQQAAHHALTAGDWNTSVKSLGGLLRCSPDDARAWFLFGYALHRCGRLEEAIVANRQAASLSHADHYFHRTALYNWACELALMQRHAEALAKLDEAIAAGFSAAHILENDEDWARLRDASEFQHRLRVVRGRMARAEII